MIYRVFLLFVALCGVNSQLTNFTCDDETKLFLTRRHDVVLEQRQLVEFPDVRVNVRAGEHDLIEGECDGADIYDKYNFTDCTMPGTGNTTRYYNVRYNGHVELYCIRVVDQVVNEEGEDLGGYAFIDQGGIGTDFIEIRLVSQEGQGMKFLMELYTRVLSNTRPPTTIRN